MIKKGGLGKGMAALLQVAEPVAGEPRNYFLCPIEKIKPNRNQPRKHFSAEKLEELAASIREKGIIQPLVVTRKGDYYEIIAGERRWRASQKAGLHELPVVIREASDDLVMELALIENIQRQDLNAIEEAEAYEVLAREHELTQEQLAERVGKERSTVANALRLLRLPGDVRDAVRTGQLEMGHARALLGLEQAEAIRRAAQRVLKESLSVRATEALVRELSGQGKVRRPPPTETPGTRDLAARLSRRLGCRCRVQPRTKVAGKLEIEYTSLEELDGILQRIGA